MKNVIQMYVFMCSYLDFSKRTSNVVTTFANLQMTKNVYTHLKLAGMGPLHAHYKITCIYYAYTKLNAFALIWYTLNINESVTINYLRTNFWIFSLRVRQDLLLKIAIMHACNICLLYIWTLMALYSGRCFLNHSCWWWYSNWRLGTIPRRRYISISISVPHQLTRTSPQTCGRARGSSSCSGSQVPEIVYVFESRSSNSLQGQCTTWNIGTIRYDIILNFSWIVCKAWYQRLRML